MESAAQVGTVWHNKHSITQYAVAYAGFSKGEGPGNSENLRITKTRMKIFPPRISPFFLSKKDQKKGLHPKLVRFLAQN